MKTDNSQRYHIAKTVINQQPCISNPRLSSMRTWFNRGVCEFAGRRIVRKDNRFWTPIYGCQTGFIALDELMECLLEENRRQSGHGGF